MMGCDVGSVSRTVPCSRPTAVSTTRRAAMVEVPWSASPVMGCNVGSVSLLISIISTYRSHIRRPFDGTIRRASLEYVLVPTAVSTTRRALSPCYVEGSLDKPVNLDNQHLSQPL